MVSKTADQKCPFCFPAKDDEIVLRSSRALAFCDARPVRVGHILIVPNSHCASMLDLDSEEQSYLRLVQSEIARRVSSHFGSAAAYEHGRTAICRFHQPTEGHCHAHIHVIPLSVDVVSSSDPEEIWETAPRIDQLAPKDRYVYQRRNPLSKEEWAKISGWVPRHFIRTVLEIELQQRGESFFPFERPPSEHRRAIEETASVIRRERESSRPGVVAIALPAGLSTRELMRRIARDLGWWAVDVACLFRIGARLASPSVIEDWRVLFQELRRKFLEGRAHFKRPPVEEPGKGVISIEGQSYNDDRSARRSISFIELDRDNAVWTEISGIIESELRHQSELTFCQVMTIEGSSGYVSILEARRGHALLPPSRWRFTNDLCWHDDSGLWTEIPLSFDTYSTLGSTLVVEALRLRFA